MLRRYKPTDLPTVIRLIGECFLHDAYRNFHPSDFVHWMSNGYAGERLEHHFHVAEENGQILAVAQLHEKSGDYNPVIAIEKRGSEWELDFHKACIAIMQERMKETEAKTITASFALNDIAAKTYFEQLGFKAEKSPHIVAKCNLDDIPEVQLPDGFSIRSVAGEHEAQLVADVHDGAFRPKWSEARLSQGDANARL